jgi:hypothetical protein
MPPTSRTLLSSVYDMSKNIEARWARVGYDACEFVSIANSESAKYKLETLYDPGLILSLLSDPGLAAIQTPSLFSNLNLKLFDNGRFFVEVLNWTDEDTSIHDHNFAGVQVQLIGRSLNVNFQFEEKQRVSESCGIGVIRFESATLLGPGDTRLIPPGTSDKHTVIHLDMPTVSMVIRTHAIPVFSPQRNYFPPYLQADYATIDLSFRKITRAIRLIGAFDAIECRSQIFSLLEVSDLQKSFWLIVELADLVFREDVVGQLVDVVTKRGPTFEAMLASAATFKTYKDLLSHFKPSLVSQNERLAHACLAAAYDAPSYHILRGWIEQETGVEVDRVLDQIAARSDEFTQMTLARLRSDYSEMSLAAE